MIALLRATLLLFRTHLTRILFTKRIAFCALIALAPAGIPVLAGLSDNGPSPLEMVLYPGWHIYLGFVVPIVALITGSAVISEELDDRTITYLFTRPFPRAALLLGRWLATAAILAALLAVGCSALVLTAKAFAPTPEGAELPPAAVAPLIEAAMLGGAAYSALFAALGTFLKRPMIVGLGYVFLIEVLLARMPGRNQNLAIVYHLWSYVGSSGDVWQRVYEDSETAIGTQDGALKALTLVMIVSLAIGSIVVSRKQYVLTS